MWGGVGAVYTCMHITYVYLVGRLYSIGKHVSYGCRVIIAIITNGLGMYMYMYTMYIYYTCIHTIVYYRIHMYI